MTATKTWFKKRGGMEVGSIVMAGSMMPRKEALGRRSRRRRRRKARRRRKSRRLWRGLPHVRQRWSLGTQSTKSNFKLLSNLLHVWHTLYPLKIIVKMLFIFFLKKLNLLKTFDVFHYFENFKENKSIHEFIFWHPIRN